MKKIQYVLMLLLIALVTLNFLLQSKMLILIMFPLIVYLAIKDYRFAIVFMVIFIPLRELLSVYHTGEIKFLADAAVFGLFLSNFKNIKKFGVLEISLIVYVLLGTFSTLSNGLHIKVAVTELRSLFLYFFLFVSLKNTVINKESSELFIKVNTWMATIIGIHGMIEKLFNKTLLIPKVWQAGFAQLSEYNQYRVYGLVKNPNILAMYMIISIALFLYYIHINNLKIKLIHFGIIGVCLKTLEISYSRSAWISFVFLCIYFIIKYRRMIYTYLVSMIVGWVMVSTIFVGTYNLLDKIGVNPSTYKLNNVVERITESYDEVTIEKSTSEGRIFTIIKGVEIFKDYPVLGSGFGTFGDSASLIYGSPIYKNYNIPYDDYYVDNMYIKVLVENGIVGSLAYLIFLIFAFRSMKGAFIKGLFLSSLVLGLFYNAFEIQLLNFFFWIIFTYDSTLKEANVPDYIIYSGYKSRVQKFM